MDAGTVARDVALERLTLANQEWIDQALDAIRDMVRGGRTRLTSDDVWVALASLGVPPPREPRALGAAMVAARKAGIITPTQETIQSTRRANHGRFVRVWSVTSGHL